MNNPYRNYEPMRISRPTWTSRQEDARRKALSITHLGGQGSLVPFCEASGPAWTDRDITQVDCPDCLAKALAIVEADGDVEIDTEA